MAVASLVRVPVFARRGVRSDDGRVTTSTFPDDVAAIDTMMGTRAGQNAKLNYANLTRTRRP